MKLLFLSVCRWEVLVDLAGSSLRVSKAKIKVWLGLHSLQEAQGFSGYGLNSVPCNCRIEVPFSFFFFFFFFYCCSITVVCIFSPPLHPTPAKPTSLPHLPHFLVSCQLGLVFAPKPCLLFLVPSLTVANLSDFFFYSTFLATTRKSSLLMRFNWVNPRYPW